MDLPDIAIDIYGYTRLIANQYSKTYTGNDLLSTTISILCEMDEKIHLQPATFRHNSTISMELCDFFFHHKFLFIRSIPISIRYRFAIWPATLAQFFYSYVPFYMLYVFFLTLHIKFAYSTYRVGLRYGALNNALRDLTACGKFCYLILLKMTNDIFIVIL